MATTSEARALPFFTDLIGQPLSSGSIYIGQPGLDPVAYPAVVTSDLAGTTVVQQPVRTTNGRAVSAGSQIHLFCPIPYSITILDSAGRTIYASLNETDAVANNISLTGVQSAPDLASLRARNRNATNQVMVDGFGMYVYTPTDNTSPESIPFMIVGNDGGRYKLDLQYINAVYVKAGSAATPNSPGSYLSWSDGGDGATYVTNNSLTGGGGVVMRTVSPDGATETGRLALNSSGVVTTSGDFKAGNNLIASGGEVAVTADGTRGLIWDSVNGRYNLPSAPLFVNGAQAITESNLLAETGSTLANIFTNRLVGCTLIGTSPPTPGTWAVMVAGVGSSGINQYVRTA